MSESIADTAVRALNEVQAMDERVDSNHPLRHTVREMKQVAQCIISNAMDQAARLAYCAERMVKDYDEAKKKGGA